MIVGHNSDVRNIRFDIRNLDIYIKYQLIRVASASLGDFFTSSFIELIIANTTVQSPESTARDDSIIDIRLKCRVTATCNAKLSMNGSSFLNIRRRRGTLISMNVENYNVSISISDTAFINNTLGYGLNVFPTNSLLSYHIDKVSVLNNDLVICWLHQRYRHNIKCAY